MTFSVRWVEWRTIVLNLFAQEWRSITRAINKFRLIDHIFAASWRMRQQRKRLLQWKYLCQSNFHVIENVIFACDKLIYSIFCLNLYLTIFVSQFVPTTLMGDIYFYLYRHKIIKMCGFNHMDDDYIAAAVGHIHLKRINSIRKSRNFMAKLFGQWIFSIFFSFLLSYMMLYISIIIKYFSWTRIQFTHPQISHTQRKTNHNLSYWNVMDISNLSSFNLFD